MKISDEVLNRYKKLSRNGNTWGFSFKISGDTTKFLVKQFNTDYIVFIAQMDKQELFEDIVCLGLLISVDDLEDLFRAITRGGFLS